MEEIWKSVVGYEGLYEVSNFGRVKSLVRIVRYRTPNSNGTTSHTVKEKFKVSSDNGNGYMSVILNKNGVSKNKYVHRLVAEAFIPNPKNKKEVNHIDYNRANNHINNLEWVTSKENYRHSVCNRKERTLKIRIIATQNDTETVIINLKKWCEENNCDRASVYRVLNKEIGSHHGIHFRYENESFEVRKKKYRLGKTIEVTKPNGETEVLFEGVTKFCKENNLNPSSALRVARKERKIHKGHKFKYID